MTPDENYFYTSTDFANYTTKFNLFTHQLEYNINTGFDPILGPIRPEYIAVFPNNPNSIVVSKRAPGSQPSHYGLAIYDGTTMRPLTTLPGYGSNMTEFVNENTLIGLTLEGSQGDFRFKN